MVFKVSLEDFEKIVKTLSKYKTSCRSIDDEGRFSIDKKFSGKYIQYVVLKHQKYYLIIGLIVEPQDFVRDIINPIK